jgi:hypothetical protein
METTRILRRPKITDDDIQDPADLEREAENRGFNRGLELAACLVRLDGDRRLAALIKRQCK